MFWLMISVALAGGEPNWAAATSADGWAPRTTAETPETGVIALSTKDIGVPCLRGEMVLDAPGLVLREVVADVAAAPKFSHETLLISRMLAVKDGHQDYVQALDVPNWTMASDRYWVLRGERTGTDAAPGFRWWRFDWRTDYPALGEELDKIVKGGVEPQTNWGYWSFTSKDGRTAATYVLCTDAGGSLPQWVQNAAATKTLPSTMADVAREASKRSKGPG